MNAPVEQRIELLQALAVCAELTGSEMSEAAARVMAEDLAAYPHAQVLSALARCRRELKGRITIAAILERLDDGRPGPNEAWAMIPQDESGSVVWTDEMAAAFGVAAPLLHAEQIIAARSAFIEAYERLAAEARAQHRPVRWTPSLGHDPATRERALNEAVRLGRITRGAAQALLPDLRASATVVPLLVSPAMPDHVRKQLGVFVAKAKRGST